MTFLALSSSWGFGRRQVFGHEHTMPHIHNLLLGVKCRKKLLVVAAGVRPKAPPVVKICGVSNVQDAVIAAEAGARYIGMILWPKSRRSVGEDTAKAISKAIKKYNAEPVAVFVDEDVNAIERQCALTNISIAQLHGDGSRASLANLTSSLRKIFALHVNSEGVIQTAIPETDTDVDWYLLDSLKGGSGHAFNWERLDASSLYDRSRSGWFLAGGLNPENVATAISMLQPNGVDVSSGVTMPDGLNKDPARISKFMNEVLVGCSVSV